MAIMIQRSPKLSVLASEAAHKLNNEIIMWINGRMRQGVSITSMQPSIARWIDEAFERGELTTQDSALMLAHYNIAR